MKRDKRKGEHVVKTESANAFTRKMLWTKDTGNIINYDERCIKLLHFILPVGNSNDYCHSCEFRPIICPLNKQCQNKQYFGKICKIQAFEVDININFLKLL